MKQRTGNRVKKLLDQLPEEGNERAIAKAVLGKLPLQPTTGDSLIASQVFWAIKDIERKEDDPPAFKLFQTSLPNTHETHYYLVNVSGRAIDLIYTPTEIDRGNSRESELSWETLHPRARQLAEDILVEGITTMRRDWRAVEVEYIARMDRLLKDSEPALSSPKAVIPSGAYGVPKIQIS